MLYENDLQLAAKPIYHI